MDDLSVANATQPPRSPRGFQATRIDATGRLKLPAQWVKYIYRMPDQILFVTRTGDLARMYAHGAWERELAKLASEPAVQKRVAFTAEAFGADVEVDPQGRITLPQKLRDALGLEGKDVQLRFYEDIITIYVQDRFDSQLAANLESAPSDMAKAESLGFDLG
jgi:DNA-binding transcriptional regulator/RsmH inhibitor MraZ